MTLMTAPPFRFGGRGRDRFQEGVDPTHSLLRVALGAGTVFEFHPVRHVRAVIAHLDSDVRDRRNNAGRRGRFGGDQVDTCLIARRPGILDRVVELVALLPPLCGHMEIVLRGRDVRTTKDLYRTVARALKAWPS
jgi:hypothetical protein